MAVTTMAYAAGESLTMAGNANQKPLRFESATLADGSSVEGSTSIPTAPKLRIAFDGNIIDDTVWDGNSRCFKLIMQSGDAMPIQVSKADAGSGVHAGRTVYIEPRISLNPGNSYRLHISPGLRSEDGATLSETTGGKGITIAFKTKPAPPVQPIVPKVPVVAQPKAKTSKPKKSGADGSSNSGQQSTATTVIPAISSRITSNAVDTQTADRVKAFNEAAALEDPSRDRGHSWRAGENVSKDVAEYGVHNPQKDKWPILLAALILFSLLMFLVLLLRTRRAKQ